MNILLVLFLVANPTIDDYNEALPHYEELGHIVRILDKAEANGSDAFLRWHYHDTVERYWLVIVGEESGRVDTTIIDEQRSFFWRRPLAVAWWGNPDDWVYGEAYYEDEITNCYLDIRVIDRELEPGIKTPSLDAMAKDDEQILDHLPGPWWAELRRHIDILEAQQDSIEAQRTAERKLAKALWMFQEYKSTEKARKLLCP